MDAKLKLKLNEATGAVFAKYKKTGLDSPKVGLASPKAESSTLSRRLADLTRRHLSRKAQWGNIQAELALEALVQIFDRKLRPRQSENENQFMLPGFDHLPKSVHIGKVRTGLLKLDVPRFLDYVAWRELRVQRDQQQAEELQRLALMVTPYKQTGLTVAEAFERAKTQPSKLSVVTKIG